MDYCLAMLAVDAADRYLIMLINGAAIGALYVHSLDINHINLQLHLPSGSNSYPLFLLMNGVKDKKWIQGGNNFVALRTQYT